MTGFVGLRVLVVEDEPVVAMCLEDILECLGCITIGPASRLAEGRALAEAGGLDAAILDIIWGASTARASPRRSAHKPSPSPSLAAMAPRPRGSKSCR